MSQKNFMSYGDAETLFTEVGQELSDKVPTSQLTANNTPFRFGYDENTGKYGYILNEGGADTVIPFKDCDSSEITVSAANQILSGYKDYDSNGNLITGTNAGYDAGYDAGVTQGEANMKDGVTVTAASQLLSGYKARTSDGTLVTGSDAGYSAGVTAGENNMKDGVTVTAASQIINGYKARNSSGTLITGTDKGYSAGVTQGHADRDSGVTVTDPYHILSGYKGRKSNGELVTGTNGGWDAGRNQGRADRDSGVTVTAASQIVSGYKARNSSGTLLTGTATTRPNYSESNPRVNLTVTENTGNIKWVGNWAPTQKIMLESQDTHCKVTGHTNSGGDSTFGIYVNGSLVTNLDGNGNGVATFSNKSYVEIKPDGDNHTQGNVKITYSITIW